jgi:flagellar export protein FliJ
MVRKFVFPFAKLLRIRKHQTDNAKKILGVSLDNLNNRVRELDIIRMKEARERINMAKIINESALDISRARNTARTLEGYRNIDIQYVKDIHELEEDVEDKRKLLQEAVKEEEKFNKYQERLYRNFKKKENRELNKQIDEIASRIYTGKTGIKC